MNNSFAWPRYVKFPLIFLSLCLIIVLVYLAQHILVPLLLALVFAILLRPVVSFFNRRLHFPNVIAALTAITLSILVVAAILFFISWQVSDVGAEWAKIRSTLSHHFEKVQLWILQRLNMSYSKQQNYIDSVTTENVTHNRELMGATLNSFTGILVNVMLIPIYTFLMLLYRNLFVRFLKKIIKPGNHPVLSDILTQVKVVVQSYIVGLMIETLIVSILTTIGLMLLGVEHALFLGVITGILNLIPYIGILIASGITILSTLVTTTDLTILLGVLGLSVLVQFIDNNILVPRIVGNKVRINALVSMLSVIAGGTIAGFAGMFLAIPLIAIIKVIFDRIESLAPFGYLIGDDISKIYTWGKIKLPDLNHDDYDERLPAQENNIRPVTPPNEKEDSDITKGETL